MSIIGLNFGRPSDETDVGLGFITNYIMFDTDTKEIDWDCSVDKRFGCPKSDSPQDVIGFIRMFQDYFVEDSDAQIDLFCEILLES